MSATNCYSFDNILHRCHLRRIILTTRICPAIDCSILWAHITNHLAHLRHASKVWRLLLVQLSASFACCVAQTLVAASAHECLDAAR